MINYTGSTAIPYDLTEDKNLKFSAKKILSLITNKTRLLIINNPNNPTGSLVEKSEIDILAEGLIKHPNVTLSFLGSQSHFGDFINKYDIITSVIHTPEDYRELTYNYLKQCAAENVLYVEAMISSTHAKLKGMTYHSFLEV